MSHKDLWFAEYERRLNELEDRGLPPALAEELAAEKAFDATRERLADIADAAKKRGRGG
jgi:hypothetical protein